MVYKIRTIFFSLQDKDNAFFCVFSLSIKYNYFSNIFLFIKTKYEMNYDIKKLISLKLYFLRFSLSIVIQWITKKTHDFDKKSW